MRNIGVFKIFFLLFVLSVVFSFLPQDAQALNSECDVGSVSYDRNSNTITVVASVRESSPGLDNSQVLIYIYDTGSNGSVTRSVNQDSVVATYTATPFGPGSYTAWVEGETTSNPGAFHSSCSDFYDFTVTGPNVWELVVSKPGSGSGYVYSSNIGGIDCGGDCSENYNENTWVTLEASPSSGSNFTGWGGECSGTGSCTFQMGGNRYVTANFEVAQTAPGPFNVTTSYCFGWPNPVIEVNLNPSSGATYYTLQKWMGSYWADIYTGSYADVDRHEDGNISMGTTYYYQVVAYNGAGQSTVSNNYISHTPTASDCGQVLYNLNTYVSSGSGTINGASNGQGDGISCGSNCSESIESGRWVNLIATPSTGYTFSSWSGACATQGSSCWFLMDGNKSTSASFGTNTYILDVTKNGTGTGTVSGTGISCPGDCSEVYNYNTSVLLTASPAAGTTFAGWGGACSGTNLTCTVVMSAARSVTATFGLNTYSITAQIPGGYGTISGTGINCSNSGGGNDCGETYNYGTVVTLTASPASNYTFSGWSSDCSSAGTGSCQLTMTSNKTASANFAVVPFNYSLSSSGPSNVTKSSGNEFTQNTITKTLTAGATQSVDLSLSGVPSGTTYTISNKTCSPTCTSNITFTVGPTTPVGTHNITVSGSPLNKTTNFNLVVTGAPISVACSGSPATVFLNQTVNWTSTVSGGRAPLTYAWSGTAIPTSPAPNSSSYSRSYTTIGQKTAQLTVTDADGTVSTCPAATVQVNFDPNFREF